ncbi:hypothetical protein P280DRAFT_466496 [Massarina eburnea CBS 473.64]|uniref:Uncharacterized protein n=1 Tax=Massarina eburnea CBS 473.64 TaxID=1395130 RepID=A0A6A6S7P1_9PLEO|nr:hypothetical protein P280DRAFT_466496 [Massarina eburnea CBS 473.64]
MESPTKFNEDRPAEPEKEREEEHEEDEESSEERDRLLKAIANIRADTDRLRGQIQAEEAVYERVKGDTERLKEETERMNNEHTRRENAEMLETCKRASWFFLVTLSFNEWLVQVRPETREKVDEMNTWARGKLAEYEEKRMDIEAFERDLAREEDV